MVVHFPICCRLISQNFHLSSQFSLKALILTLCPLGNFSCFLSSAILLLFLSKSTFLTNSFRNTIWVSNRFDPDQARRFVWPDLGPICLPRLSADNTRRLKVKWNHCILVLHFFEKTCKKRKICLRKHYARSAVKSIIFTIHIHTYNTTKCVAFSEFSNHLSRFDFFFVQNNLFSGETQFNPYMAWNLYTGFTCRHRGPVFQSSVSLTRCLMQTLMNQYFLWIVMFSLPWTLCMLGNFSWFFLSSADFFF